MMPLLRQALVIVSIVAMIAINGLANALPINGLQTGAVADRFDVLFVPAGYVFSIWGLIYLALLVYAGYQALPRSREDERVRSVDAFVILSCVANGSWIFAWHYQLFGLSLVVMLVLLASLIGVYVRLDIGRTAVEASQRWCVDLPFSIYLGWITVATIANASTVLVDLGWGGWGLSDFVWLVVMLVAALAIASAMAWTRGDVAYLGVLVWAFVGIAVKHADTQAIAVVAGASAAVVAGLIGVAWVRARGLRPARAALA